MNRRKRAEAIVERSAAWAFASGLVPIPAIDVAALTLVEVRMLEKLAELYEQPFSRARADAYITSLLGSFAAAQLGLVYLKAGLSLIPVLGPLLGAASMSMTSATITYAIGRMFIVQFESGGTFMDFNPASAQSSPREEPPSVAEATPPVAEATPPVAPPTPTQLPEPESAGAAATTAQDDLELVIGIGPKIEELLATKGISTFAELAATPVDLLKTILQDAGPRYAHHDPTTWPAQAKLLMEGKLDQLQAFVAEAQRS